MKWLKQLWCLIVLIPFFGFSQVSAPSLSAGVDKVAFQQGQLDAQLIANIISTKQEEIRSELAQRLVLKPLDCGNFALWNYARQNLDLLFNEKDKNVITKNMLRYGAELAMVYGLAEFYLQDLAFKSRQKILTKDEKRFLLQYFYWIDNKAKGKMMHHFLQKQDSLDYKADVERLKLDLDSGQLNRRKVEDFYPLLVLYWRYDFGEGRVASSTGEYSSFEDKKTLSSDGTVGFLPRPILIPLMKNNGKLFQERRTPLRVKFADFPGTELGLLPYTDFRRCVNINANHILIDFIYDVCKNNKAVRQMGFFQSIGVSEETYSSRNKYLQFKDNAEERYGDSVLNYGSTRESVDELVTLLFSSYHSLKQLKAKGLSEKLNYNAIKKIIDEIKLDCSSNFSIIQAIDLIEDAIKQLKTYENGLSKRLQIRLEKAKAVLKQPGQHFDVTVITSLQTDLKSMAQNDVYDLLDLPAMQKILSTMNLDSLKHGVDNCLEDLRLNILNELYNPKGKVPQGFQFTKEDQEMLDWLKELTNKLGETDFQTVSFYLDEKILPRLTALNISTNGAFKNLLPHLKLLQSLSLAKALEPVANFTKKYYEKLYKEFKPALLNMDFFHLGEMTVFGDLKKVGAMRFNFKAYLELIESLNNLDKVGTYDKIFKFILDIGDLYSDKSVGMVLNTIANGVDRYLLMDQENNLVEVDVESMAVDLYEHFAANNSSSFRMHFTVGSNYAVPAQSFEDAGNDSARVAFVSEKIGVSVKLKNWNRKRSYFKYNLDNKRFEKVRRKTARAYRKPIISDLHLTGYFSGLLYQVEALNSDDSFDSPLYGVGLGVNFFNGLDFNGGYAVPFNRNLENGLVTVGFDILFTEYLGELRKKKK